MLKASPNPYKRFWRALTRFATFSGLPRDDAETIARTWIREISGQTSLKQLTPAQLGAVCSRLDARGGRPPETPPAQPAPTPRPAPARAPQDLPTPEQQQALHSLGKTMGWSRDQLAAFCQGHSSCKHPWPQTRAEANAIIEALKSMVARKVQLNGRAVTTHRDELLAQLEALSLTEWERAFLAKVKGGRMTVPQKLKLEEIYKKRLGGGP